MNEILLIETEETDMLLCVKYNAIGYYNSKRI